MKTLLSLFIAIFIIGTSISKGTPAEKEWAFLIFLNANNNLASYSDINLNQLETVGSTADIDIIVQWAKQGNDKTYRLKIEKDNDTQKVTSPFVQTLPRVDMGDYHQLVDFVKWSVEHYPAKHYFIAFWNHGSGWYRNKLAASRGISYDDYSGHHISTPEMGLAMAEISKLIGHKVELVGADACLMAMAEVADEMSPYAETFVASEELEPGLGWPYHTLLERWAKQPLATANQVGSILTEEYLKWLGQSREVTLSTMDLTHFNELTHALSDFGHAIAKLSPTEIQSLNTTGTQTTGFYYADAIDLGHFISQVSTSTSLQTLNATTEPVRKALERVIVSNHTSPSLNKATGISIWWPTLKSTLTSHFSAYQQLKFVQRTGWDKILSALPLSK